MERLYKYKSRVTANWDRIPKVEGRIIDKGSMTLKGKARPYLKVDTEDGEVTVFESAGLDDLFSAAGVGDFVSVEYLATVVTAKGHSFRQFRSSCWTEPDAEPISAPKRRGRKPKDAAPKGK
jgi:hypothetical protein